MLGLSALSSKCSLSRRYYALACLGEQGHYGNDEPPLEGHYLGHSNLAVTS